LDSISRGFAEGERIARLSTYTLLAIGVVEMVVGQLSNSVGLTADGLDSLGDAVISGIVWFGLRISKKAPDKRFHYGYFRMETFSALITAIAMAAVAMLILYEAYQRFLNPIELSYPLLTLVTLLGAGGISLYRAFQMRRISKKYGLLALRTGAYNSIKDGSASFIIFFSLLASYMGFHYMDAVGAMVISGFILHVSYVAIRESSLVLVDACQCPELMDEIRAVVEGTYKVKVKEIKLRRLGPYLTGELRILVDGNLTLYEVSRLRVAIEKDIKKEIEGIKSFTITADPYPARAPT